MRSKVRQKTAHARETTRPRGIPFQRAWGQKNDAQQVCDLCRGLPQAGDVDVRRRQAVPPPLHGGRLVRHGGDGRAHLDDTGLPAASGRRERSVPLGRTASPETGDRSGGPPGRLKVCQAMSAPEGVPVLSRKQHYIHHCERDRGVEQEGAVAARVIHGRFCRVRERSRMLVSMEPASRHPIANRLNALLR